MSQRRLGRVVVTGLGPVSPIGVGKLAFFKALREGTNGAKQSKVIDTTGFEKAFTSEIREDINYLIESDCELNKRGKSSGFAIAATQLAIEDAGLSREALFGKRINCYFGTTDGESALIDFAAQSILDDNLEAFSRSDFNSMFPSEISRNVLKYIRSTGEAMTIGNACSASNAAICTAADAIILGDCDLAICGGSDSVCRKSFACFHRLGALDYEMCRPFDSNRKGIIPAEGASVLILESLNSALSRGATIYGEILGYSINCDAINMSIPDVDSIADCMRACIKKAAIQKEDIDYVCAHGTGTKANDSTEFNALKQVFGNEIPPCSSIKSMLGHAMGAAAGFGAIASMLALQEGIPPTMNLLEQDPLIKMDVVANDFRKVDVSIVMNNAFAFGGNNSIVIFGRYQNHEK